MNKRIILCSLLALAFVLTPRSLQARWLNASSGRFLTMDSYEGSPSEPQSLHKYTYAHDDPVNGIDPSGHEYSAIGVTTGTSTQTGLRSSQSFGAIGTLEGAVTVAQWNATVAGYQGAVGGSLLYKGTAAGIAGATIAGHLAAVYALVIDSTSPEVEGQRVELQRQVETEARNRGCNGRLLYFYSDAPTVAQSWGSRLLPTSGGSGADFPEGGYASDISPWDLRFTQQRLAYGFYEVRSFDALSKGVGFFVGFCAEEGWRPLPNVITPGILHWNNPQKHPSFIQIRPVAVGVNMMAED